MKKIGIITFHSAINYGAVLQAVALQNKIEQLGASCDIVDYKNLKFKRLYGIQKKFSNTNIVFKSLLFLIKNSLFLIKRIKFKYFLKKHSKLSKMKYAEENIADSVNEYDKFITGSDQVWNLRLTDNDKNYFLDFAPDDKKYSYAASFGITSIPENQFEIYKRLLQSFRKISVRENSGKDIGVELTSSDVYTHIDPTLLFTGNDWIRIYHLKKNSRKEKYILLYLVAAPKELVEYTLKKSKEFGYKVIEVSQQLKKSDDSFVSKRICSPREFTDLILNAEYIATTSFHASVFSILFHKKMIVETVDKNGKFNIRISDLFNSLEIKRQENNNIWTVEKNDWDLTENKLSTERSKSITYLQQIISE